MCLKEFRSKSRKRGPPRRRHSDSLPFDRAPSRDCAMLTSFAATYRRSSSSRASRGLRDGLRLPELKLSSPTSSRRRFRLSGEGYSFMATDLSICHPGDGVEALNRLPGLAEPILQIDMERELQQLRQEDSWPREAG